VSNFFTTLFSSFAADNSHSSNSCNQFLLTGTCEQLFFFVGTTLFSSFAANNSHSLNSCKQIRTRKLCQQDSCRSVFIKGFHWSKKYTHSFKGKTTPWPLMFSLSTQQKVIEELSAKESDRENNTGVLMLKVVVILGNQVALLGKDFVVLIPPAQLSTAEENKRKKKGKSSNINNSFFFKEEK
jgi:hypothetical protein